VRGSSQADQPPPHFDEQPHKRLGIELESLKSRGLTSWIETIPDHWRRYKVTKGMGVSQWIPNLARRLAQLEKISQLDSFDDVEVWLGGLFFPEAYVTATRQAVAHRNSWSLETLNLRLDLNQADNHEGFIVQGITFYRCWEFGNSASNVLQVLCSKAQCGLATI
jgi:hypothetical protein